MSHSTHFALALMLTWALGCQPAPRSETATMGAESEAAPAGLSAEDEAAIRALDANWGKVATAGDGNAIAALYAADATVMPPMEPAVKGDAIKKYFVDLTTNFSGPFEINTASVEGRGDLAYATGTYRSSLTPKKGGKAVVEEGKYLEVLKKQPDGSWKIVYDIWNPNAAPAAR
ncbi:MAG: SgcJ/EcaC family oxidoreductase [Gemmataceae bacterium]|nr:SgcJ/EcaC family oxidoreductase [Gemmataceae bacterium]